MSFTHKLAKRTAVLIASMSSSNKLAKRTAMLIAEDRANQAQAQQNHHFSLAADRVQSVLPIMTTTQKKSMHP